MKIAILSDIHDQIPRLRAALKKLSGVEALLCCGDLCSPFIMKELGQGFTGPLHIVFGNNDGDLYRLTETSKAFPQIRLHGEFVELTLGGKRIAINHFDHLGRALAAGSHYDVVCFGHNHQFEVTRVANTLLINPGEIFGGLTGHSTFVLYDTATDRADRVDIE